MPRTRPAYPPEFRVQIVALARAGRRVEDLAREFEPCAHTIRGWIRWADRARTGGSGPATVPVLSDEEREELRRLRKENRQLRQERDILAKAAAWFAQSDAMSSRSSTS
jgi:transposase